MSDVFTDEQGWRFYGEPGPETPVSVTTILGQAVANPGLMNWYKKNSENKIEKVKSTTAKFGTDCHELFAKTLQGENPAILEIYETQMRSFNVWREENKVKAIKCEFPVASKNMGFAGTVDCLAQIGDKIFIIDWKTSARYDIKNGWQLAAYRRAAIEMGIVDESCGIMGVQISRETGLLKAFKYEHIDFVDYAFRASLEVFKALHFHKLNKLNWKWLKERSI